MWNNLESVIRELENEIEIEKILVEDEVTAMQVKYRSSPPLLINGEDLLGIPAPSEPLLACRYYHKEIPTLCEIKKNFYRN